MTNTTKTTIAKKKTPAAYKSKPTNTTDRPSKRTFEKTDWIMLPVGVLVVTCLYVALADNPQSLLFANPFYAAFWFPPLPSLLIALFGVLYISYVLRKKPTRKLANAMMYVLFVMLVIFLLFFSATISGQGHLCPNSDGTSSDCSLGSGLALYLILANPFSLMALSAVAITGGAALLVKSKK